MWTRTALRRRATAFAAFPRCCFFKDGKVADQIVGYVPQDVIEEKVQKVLGIPTLS
jgi:thioredoxin-like negative regulator of GroEL